ncbi:pilus assembly FimT family protein [Amedibacillus sp. YH-ame10]
MKNNKGMTLMETLMAIFILSIAGLMIMTGFANVIRVMGNANTVKNQSNALLSKAEKTDSETNKEVVTTSKTMDGVKIKNFKGKQVSAKYNVSEHSMKSDGIITLKSIQNAASSKVDPDVVNNANSFYLRVTERANAFLNGGYNTKVGLNFIFKKDAAISDGSGSYYPEFNAKDDYIRYPIEILPLKESAIPYYLKAYYPWEHAMQDSNAKNVLIYLSKYDKYHEDNDYSSTENAVKEVIHFVYNYENSSWYYYEGDDYVMTYAPLYNLRGFSALSYKGNSDWMNWDTFKLQLSDKSIGWKKLDMNAEYNPSNPDDIWK